MQKKKRDLKPTSLLSKLGPGLITGASDDDPSGIATYSQVGAQFGFGMLWTALFSFPLMVAIQEIAARLGRVTGHGIAGNLRRHYSPWVLRIAVSLLLIANVLNLGADLGAMGAAVQLLIGGPALLYVVLLGFLSLWAEIVLPYSRYVHILKWLTLALFAYVAAAFAIRMPWLAALHATLVPSFTFSRAYIIGFIAVMGTTISPYLFFWQASEEVEEEQRNGARSLRSAPQTADAELRRINLDTCIGMGFSNIITFFIMLTAAATLHTHGIVNIGTAADAAKALEPFAGKFASLLFTLGIVGTGLLAVPILSGSVAYALGEALQWKVGLELKPTKAKGFYGILSISIILGLLLNFLHIDPIQALFWSAVVNGIIAVPLMALMMNMGSNKKVMGKFTLPLWLRIGGWLTTAVMLVAVIGMAATMGG